MQPNSLTAQEIAELRRKVEAMTPSPWDAERGNHGSLHPWYIQTTEDGDGQRLDTDGNTLGVHALRNAATRLLDAAERLERIETAARLVMPRIVAHEGCACEDCTPGNALRAALEGK